MHLTIENHSSVLKASVVQEIELLRLLDEEFKISSPNYWFSKQFRRGLWDGHIHPVRVRGTAGRFETGLLGEVLEFLSQQGMSPQITDKRQIPDFRPMLERLDKDMLTGLTLRDYQMASAFEVVKKLRGVLGLATNAGKTAISAAILKAAGLPALQLTPTTEVMAQTIEDFEGFLEMPIGQAGAGVFQPQMITVGMPQTLSKREKRGRKSSGPLRHREFLKNLRVVIVDECHHMKAATWLTVLKACKAACFRVGLSGTPYSGEIAERKLTGATGPILYTVSNEFLVQKGYSAKPFFLFLRVVQPEIEYLSYEEAYKEGIVRSPERNQRIVEVCSAVPNKQKLVLVFEREHGKRLLRLLHSQGIQCEFLHGDEPLETRQQVKRQFKAGKLRTLVASTIFDEGVDIPNIDILILAAGWKTPLRFLQRVGRAMRRKKGKANVVIIVDFLDVSNYYLLEHSYNRYMTAKAEGFQIEVEEGE